MNNTIHEKRASLLLYQFFLLRCFPTCRLLFFPMMMVQKVFFMTAGGVSKASKGINLSEDIFAGYNGTIRGGQVHFFIGRPFYSSYYFDMYVLAR